MAASQKVFLRIVGLIGDSSDPDEMPDRVNVTGRGRLVPTIAIGAGDVAQGPDSLHEIRLIEPISFEIVNGMLTYNGKPYVWLPVPTGEWMWRITFDRVMVGDQLRELRDFLFPLSPATSAQIADPGYPGVNLAQYGIGAWEPGTVNLTAQAISQITIFLGRASNAAADAETSRQAAQRLVTDHEAHLETFDTETRDWVAGFQRQVEALRDHVTLSATHANTHAQAAGTASQIATTKASDASAAAGVATTKATEAAQSRADALTYRNTAQGAATTATTKATEASASATAAAGSATTANAKAVEAALSALTLSQRLDTGAKEIARDANGRPYLITEPRESVPLRVDTTVGTRVFIGDVMVHGDTGWRDISSDFTQHGWSFAGHSRYGAYIRRVGIQVHLKVLGDYTYGPTSTNFISPPLATGFAPDGPFSRRYYGLGHALPVGATPHPVSTLSNGNQIQWTSGPPQGTRQTHLVLSWTAAEAWPPSLPGTPIA